MKKNRTPNVTQVGKERVKMKNKTKIEIIVYVTVKFESYSFDLLYFRYFLYLN